MEPALVSALLAPPAPARPVVIRPADVGGRAAWWVMVRDGALRVVADDAAVPVGAAIPPEARAAAIAGRVPATAVVVGPSAVWLHCGGLAPEPLDLARRNGTRRLASESTRVGAVRVTTPTRTAIDVAAMLPHEVAVTMLVDLARAGVDLGAVARSLELRPRVVGRPRARITLAAARERLAAEVHAP
ncbi:hypothetical protein [Xylanimonas ulmi]|uniref:Transcriptional regulator with AbiEi antitoxin domain of type IV toxin-antitoxin system n=1 Tax=Xylanimonas ulmi TaxID=228973 RepID=A0A4Q7M4N9_9MICO|nr:hypothetical protein [Xylanibacterium ulmi]RZS60959.1 hypothetical protein EV386_1240 [Xylanibacterium ulmi]